MCNTIRLNVTGLTMLCLLFTLSAAAQVASSSRPPVSRALIVPQRGVFATGDCQEVEITRVDVGVVIVEQAATTTMDVSLRNPTDRGIEAELIMPAPAGIVVRSFSFEGGASEPAVIVLPENEARAMYENIVAELRDPALLEFAGGNMIRTSVFPLAPRGEQKIRLTYEQLLTSDGARVDFELPRSESLDYGVPWNIAVKIKSRTPISTLYSPSHALETKRTAPGVISARLRPGAETIPGPFRLSFLRAGEGVSASLTAYPDASFGGGYFLLLAGLPPQPAVYQTNKQVLREITLVLDQSGSMAGEKIEQVRETAKQILAGLERGEAFNIVVYSDSVRCFRPHSTIKTRENEQAARAFLDEINAQGGTNIHNALVEALRIEPSEGKLPLALFLTDGLPTVGQTSEIAIRNVATEQNPYHWRVFTFGVGEDVNTPLLESIADDTRAAATFVLPGEDVEMKVARVFKGLRGPVLTNPRIEVAGGGQTADAGRIFDLMPGRLPDLYEDDQLLLMGRYKGDEPLALELSGDYLGQERVFKLNFSLNHASTRNAFVPRLWASRKIAYLIDQIRRLGAEEVAAGFVNVRTNWSAERNPRGETHTDPRLDELTNEIVRLSTEFGILTEYTAFLAREGVDLMKQDEVLAEARGNFRGRAMASRSGRGSVNQSLNSIAQKSQQALNRRNIYFDSNMNRVEIANVQQINDRAFFRRGDRWVDSRVIARNDKHEPDRTIDFGGAEFKQLARRLLAENRQGAIAIRGEILMLIDGESVLIRSADQRP